MHCCCVLSLSLNGDFPAPAPAPYSASTPSPASAPPPAPILSCHVMMCYNHYFPPLSPLYPVLWSVVVISVISAGSDSKQCSGSRTKPYTHIFYVDIVDLTKGTRN